MLLGSTTTIAPHTPHPHPPSGRSKINPKAEEFVEKLWGQLAFLANSLIFILIGILVASVAELSLIAQLNVEADKYAGEFRNQFGSYRPLIPLSPTRSVALDIDGKMIHRGFKQAI